MVRIEISSGSETGKVVELSPGTHVVGRHSSCDLLLSVESVSGRHAEILVGADGSVRFKDLGSTNGTFSGGLKVTEGEWFPSTELRLGNALLRLVDESAAAVVSASDADGLDAAAHARAREAAMSGGRKGGPLMLLLLLAAVGGAGVAYWMFGRAEDSEAEANASGGATGITVAGPSVQTDWIDDLGQFSEDDAVAWTLAEGQAIEDGRLRAPQGGRRALLARDFDAPSAISLSAAIEGGPVYPVIEWGVDSAEEGTVWHGAPLSSSVQTLALPDSASWFRMSLWFVSQATVSSLSVDESSNSAVAASNHAGRNWLASAGNLLLEHSSGVPVLMARGGRGGWSAADGGLDYTPSNGPVGFAAGEAVVDAGILILSEGGPVPAVEGVRIEGSPGLLIGDGALRYLMRFDEPSEVVVQGGFATVDLNSPARLRWELTEDLTQTSRLERQLKNAASNEDVPGVLAAASQILRDYPLNQDAVSEALQRSREVLQAGRNALADLARERADAEFLQSIEDLVALEGEARSLAQAYAGSDLAPRAEQEAEALNASADFLREARAVQSAEYRTRLTSALSNAYPLLAAWLRAEDQS
ncbi:MAG: FHA domain-containing protein [Planctomycetes bacterium]|nr:FHA domain-containing protein [Planctomycetota bacterium]